MKDIQIKRLGKFRQRIVISILGFIYTNGELIWTGDMLGYTAILEEKIKYRTSFLDEYNYRIYWSNWIFKYRLVKIL